MSKELDKLIAISSANSTMLIDLKEMVKTHVKDNKDEFKELKNALDSKVWMKLFIFALSIVTATTAYFFVGHIDITNSITKLQTIHETK